MSRVVLIEERKLSEIKLDKVLMVTKNKVLSDIIKEKDKEISKVKSDNRAKQREINNIKWDSNLKDDKIKNLEKELSVYREMGLADMLALVNKATAMKEFSDIVSNAGVKLCKQLED